MLNDKEDLELKPLLRRLFYRGVLVFTLLITVSALISLWIRGSLQEQFAEHLSQTVRNDLLVGNNSAVLKILQQNVGENFSRISYLDLHTVLFVLEASPGRNRGLFESSVRIPICLHNNPRDCSTALLYEYSLSYYIPWVLLVAAGGAMIFLMVFWIFRQQVAAYYRVQLKSHKEAVLGRLSARICHDLKLPSMIFQRVAYVDDPAQFMEMRPQLQSHLQRLHAMIEKLKRVELEGLVRPEAQTLYKKDLQSFLASIAPTPQQLQLDMHPTIRLYLDLEKFERSLANLVLNAFQAGAQNVKVNLVTENGDLRVVVENDGPEMPADIVQSFLGKDNRRGDQSLGLQIVRDTVRAHGGSVDLESNACRTRFTLSFPNAVIDLQKCVPEKHPHSMVNSIGLSRSLLIWMDDDLLSVAQDQITKAEREPFHFTSDPESLAASRLVVSRAETMIEFAIEQAIPVIMVGTVPDDVAWIFALKTRLRLFKMKEPAAMSTVLANHVQVPGHDSSLTFE